MNDFSGKKVAVLGLGIEGQDVCRFLLRRKAKITVFDQKTVVELSHPYQALKRQGVEFSLGKNYLRKGLGGFDIIFRSPGFRPDLPVIVTAQQKGAQLSSATKLFFQLCPAKIIGVTGTKGKGTTAALIKRILKEAGKDACLAGNIGEPMLALLPKLKPSSWVVLELSSFQLIDLDQSPHIAVVLFVVSEHLDWHKDEKEYIQAKTNLVSHQKKGDLAVLNADNQISADFSHLTPADIFWFDRLGKIDKGKGAYVKNRKIYLFNKIVGKTDDLDIRGVHNWENVCAAVMAGHLAGANLAAIKKAVFTFKGLEHRLELVRKIKEIEYYNDSFSTTPETAIAAIKAFSQPIILIAGGSEKGSNFTQLGQEIAQSSVKSLILIGEMASRIKQACHQAKFRGKTIENLKTMKEIVKQASEEAKAGDIVLLSPACASFDMFKNYKDRGQQFKQHVQAL